MKLFGLEISIPKNQKMFFPVTKSVLAAFDGDLWKLVGKAESMLKQTSLKGIHYICIETSPDKIRVEFDPEITDEQAVREWLVSEGVPV